VFELEKRFEFNCRGVRNTEDPKLSRVDATVRQTLAAVSGTYSLVPVPDAVFLWL